MVTMGIKKKKTILNYKKIYIKMRKNWEKKDHEKRWRRENKEELREWWVKIKEKMERKANVFMGNVHPHGLYWIL